VGIQDAFQVEILYNNKTCEIGPDHFDETQPLPINLAQRGVTVQKFQQTLQRVNEVNKNHQPLQSFITATFVAIYLVVLVVSLVLARLVSIFALCANVVIFGCFIVVAYIVVKQKKWKKRIQ